VKIGIFLDFPISIAFEIQPTVTFTLQARFSPFSHFPFQNLPSLGFLDLSYNSLKGFEFDWLDQVGSLRHLLVNVSHNNIPELNDNATTFINPREQGECSTNLNCT
jgi:hypothetical protein